MKNLWNEKEARAGKGDPLALRVYTSRLLGQEEALVLHGGGNTSVKASAKNIFDEKEDVLYIKGSGWDLATIKRGGFAPVKMDVLKRMAEFKHLSDTDMVNGQRAAMLDPNAPTPSVEAILHAIIPFKFVDHTHADSVIAVTNTPGGEKRIRDIYGKRVLIVPYVMPGFILARKVYEMTRDINWSKLEGIILLNHGIFTFADDAKTSYQFMIKLVSQAENYLKKNKVKVVAIKEKNKTDLQSLALLRREVSKTKKSAMLARLDTGPEAQGFAKLPNVFSLATRGPLTPDHVIRTKRIALVVSKKPSNDVARFVGEYQKYFKRHAAGDLTPLDSAPRWAVWPKRGVVTFGANAKDIKIVSDIIAHTIKVIQQAQGLGGWKALDEKNIFDVEYWELEQAKLKKGGKPPLFEGKVALVTGAASGIGRACVESLHAQGGAVVAVDINPSVKTIFGKPGILGLVCNLTREEEIKAVVESAVVHFGGVDILVSNAGTFPASESIAELKNETWDKSLAVNLTSHQRLLKQCLPYLKLGIDPAVIIIASKNVPAPGPGVAAYSVAKAGLTQLARVAALELAGAGIRVNVIHPNQVFDTAIWTPEILAKRAQHYKMSVAEYKTSNLLKTEVTSRDVANLVCAVAGPVFAKTTGAQIPVDGGNDRVI